MRLLPRMQNAGDHSVLVAAQLIQRRCSIITFIDYQRQEKVLLVRTRGGTPVCVFVCCIAASTTR